jgi:hypothetical protein
MSDGCRQGHTLINKSGKTNGKIGKMEVEDQEIGERRKVGEEEEIEGQVLQ